MNVGTFRYLLVLIIVVVQFDNYECWRSRPSPSRPRPSPTYRPYPRPSPTYRPFPRPSPTFRPFPHPSPTHRPFPTWSPTRAPTYRPTTYRPFPSHTTFKPFPSHTTYRPFPSHTTYRPFPSHTTYRPFPARPNYPTNPPNYGTTRYPNRYPTQPTRYPVGPHQTYPGFQGGGVFTPSRHYQPTYSVPVRVPSPGGYKTKIYNINNYHSPSYWAPPSYPIYTYGYRDTGHSALGFYLGYSLGRITHPTYYHHSHSFYDGYSPRYDHYTVHHYYHNNANIPKEQTITNKVIIQCGDGSQICPANTTSLCTANGQIMCVVAASNTIPCKENPQLQCVRSMVPCENNESPECKGLAKGQSAAINIPCISNTVIEGNITTVNNTIISADPVNKTAQSLVTTSQSQALTPLLSNITSQPLKPLLSNITTQALIPPLSNITTSSSTLQPPVPITTLPTIETTLSSVTFPSLGSRKKRDVPQYCVTILAQPSVRAPTEGEQVYNEVSNIFEQFFSKAFGMDKPSK